MEKTDLDNKEKIDYRALPRTVKAKIKSSLLKYRFNLELALKRIEEHEKLSI